VEVYVGEEELESGQAHVVGDAHVADVAALAGGADRLHHRLLGTDRFQRAVDTEPAGELLDASHALIAALGDDVGGAVLEGELLAGLVTAHGR